MLVVGLIVTMGIGSSFATIPIIAAIFVPLAVELGLSELAIICLIGTAGVLGMPDHQHQIPHWDRLQD